MVGDGVVWCGIVWCGVLWCRMVDGVGCCVVVWDGLGWRGVVGDGVGWCGIVWYDTFSIEKTNRKIPASAETRCTYMYGNTWGGLEER